MKTNELSGALLAEWVARANGWRVEQEESPDNLDMICWDPNGDVHSFSEFGYRPDLNWAQGGPIIDREQISLEWNGDCFAGGKMWGETALIAAMRAYVASKYGDTVPDA